MCWLKCLIQLKELHVACHALHVAAVLRRGGTFTSLVLHMSVDDRNAARCSMFSQFHTSEHAHVVLKCVKVG